MPTHFSTALDCSQYHFSIWQLYASLHGAVVLVHLKNVHQFTLLLLIALYYGD